MAYCLYLRKSRADLEEETRGSDETLARHRKALLELAGKRGLEVTREYAEVVSGETIASRPVVQQLLSDVEHGRWDGVLVMEIERLARGETIDQGIVAQAFKYSDTKIITPIKTYDPANEYDEEYFEFGLFMSRREYMTIRRRLQRGRIASVREGKYTGSVPPYGYERVKLHGEKGYTLRPHPEQREVVSNIFRWYAEQGLGAPAIASRLNAAGLKTKEGKPWFSYTVQAILRNPVYAGKVKWGERAQVKSTDSGRVFVSCPRAKDYLVTDGRHEAIVSQALYDAAQKKRRDKKLPPCPGSAALANPLAGLILCGECGRHMVRMENRKRKTAARLYCATPGCPTVSSSLPEIENAILRALRFWLNGFSIPADSQPAAETADSSVFALTVRRKQLNSLRAQLERAHELVEQGIYSPETYAQRSRLIRARIAQTQEILSRLVQENALPSARQARPDAIPKSTHVLDVYSLSRSAEQKNDLLKSILSRVVYKKTARLSSSSAAADGPVLTLYPLLPK